ncbi:hypothetical protein EZS27_041481, partial [termite gut metagenome]
MEKKTIYCRFSLLMILVILFIVSCNEKTYTNVIPADAALVLSFDLKSIMDKGGLNDGENVELKQKLVDALTLGGELNAESSELFKRIIKNPAESGIDIASPMYIFSQKKTEGAAFVAKIGNKKKLKSL